LLAQEVIAAKRDGGALDEDQIAFFVQGLVDGTISEGQVAALAMAVFLNGMGRAETVALTLAMTRSGTVLDWGDVAAGRPVLDKHSTGGIGDNVSLVLAPALAACGAAVPMISGRGLGHTGGTLDKLDAIPGYVSQPDLGLFRAAVAAAGCAIVGQTADLAPADRRLYAIRDVTATVESVPLITASILSKKLAAGLGGLVLDVKTGSGAFARDLATARELAGSLVEVANGAGLPTAALITDMNQPLASAAGNAVEVANAVDFLAGRARDPRLHAVTVALGGELLALGGLAQSDAEGAERISQTFEDGSAAEHFARMVAALGGPADIVERPDARLAAAPIVRPLEPAGAGHVARIDGTALGFAVIELGGGRRRADDAIDHAVGLTRLAGLGAEVGPGRPLCLIHARGEDGFDRAARRILAAYELGPAGHGGADVIERIGPADR
jgi:thymidine phosphorylase